MMAPALPIAGVRSKLLAAAEGASAAAADLIAQCRQTDDGLAALVIEGAAFQPGDPPPLGEEVIDPLMEALRLTIQATGLLAPFHDIHGAIVRYQSGETA